jgi:ankyrin repeat protein
MTVVANTPLYMACWGGHEELARLLVAKYNCPVYSRNWIKETPLHKACLSGRSSVVRMLILDAIERDDYIDTVIGRGWTCGNCPGTNH